MRVLARAERALEMVGQAALYHHRLSLLLKGLVRAARAQELAAEQVLQSSLL